jgi:membrane protease YdiL (CAAX protease family)
MIETATLQPQETADGKRFLAAIGSSILAAAFIGGASYAAFGFVRQGVRVQAVAFLVYATLTATLCLFFRPATSGPISLRLTGAKALAASVGILIATVAVVVLFYYCLGSIFGSVPSVARQIVSFATDASRLKGQPTTAWIIAIARGCFLVPVFEEVFFRGLLLGWLRKHMREHLAVVTMSALFALEHGSFILAPYVFIFGISFGYVRLRTRSTLNTAVMHSLHNIMLLTIGLRILHV